MSTLPRFKRQLLRAMLPTLALPSLAGAATFNWSNPNGGAMNTSTNWSPSGIPGPADIAGIVTAPTLPGFITLTLPSNQAIGSLTSGHFAQNTIEGPGVLTIQTGNLTTTDGITQAPGQALNALFINTVINGSAGLTVSGPGFVRLNAANLYTGGTILGGGGGGVTVTADNNFGAAGTSITMNGGAIRAGSSFTSTRPITLGTGGGRIETFGNLTLNGAITGTSNVGLMLQGNTGGTLTLGGVNTYQGTTYVVNNSTATLLGRLTASSLFIVSGTLNLGSGTTGLAADALYDSMGIQSHGGRVNVYASSANSVETVGLLSLQKGMTTLNLEANANAGIQMHFSQMSRSGGTLFVRGRDLGNGPLAANRALITFTDGLSDLPMVGGGGTTATNDSIIPYMFGNANTTGGYSQASVVDAGFVTRTANGLRVLDNADYSTSLSGVSTNNVRITNSIVTVNSATTVNSLLVRDTLTSNGPSGVTGSGTITVTSGAIGAVSDLAGEELTIDNPLAFGSATGIVHLAPTSDGYSNLTLNGAISGTAGLTKSGSGELTLTGSSPFSGILMVNAGLVNFTGSVGTGSSALGSGNSIRINAGVTDNQYVGIRSMTPGATISRQIVVAQDTWGNSLALLGTFGGYGTTFSGPISIEGGFLNLLGDTETQVLTLSGAITGSGGLQEPNLATPIDQYIRITGGNSYDGDTIVRVARWEVGSNNAFGNGTVYFTGESTSGSLVAFGSGRTVSNRLVFRATPTFGGSNALTFTNTIDLGSVSRDIVVTNTADTTFSGVVSRGGIVKLGSGRLILSGANTHNGETIIVGGNLRAAHSSALGAATGLERQATYIGDTGALELTGNITSAEQIYFGADGLPIASARSSGNLRNVSGNNTLTSAIAFDNIGTVGVDAGSTLTLTGDTLDNTVDLSARLRKVGTGQLVVKNVRLPGLQIDAGQVRITPSGIPGGTSRVASLAISASASLDLTNNALVHDYTTTSPLGAIQAMLLDGRIGTSVATTGAAVGFAEANRLFTSFPANFAAQSIDSTTVVMIQTLDGDTNLDRIVNFDDLLKLAQNYSLTGKSWVDGDFDYNGTVNFDDLLALAQNYGGSVSLAQFPTDRIDPQFATDFALAMSIVPEPTSLAALGLPALLARRRRSMR